MELEKDNCIEIKKVENGFIIKQVYLNTETKDGRKIYTEEITVVEEEDGINSEKDVMIQLLYEIADKFGIDYDKFSSENLNITFDKKGHKVE